MIFVIHRTLLIIFDTMKDNYNLLDSLNYMCHLLDSVNDFVIFLNNAQPSIVLGGGGSSQLPGGTLLESLNWWIHYLFHFLSAELIFCHTLPRAKYLFHLLSQQNSVYTIGSQTRLSSLLNGRFKGHFMKPSEVRLNTF